MFFEKTISARFREDELKIINEIVNTNKEVYENKSHFLRVAALKLIRKHKK